MTQAQSSSNNDEIAIRVRNLKKSFGRFDIHKNLDIDIPRGKITYIMGGSGTGKSLLLKQIMGFIKPDSGTIVVDGKDMHSATEKETRKMRSNMGILFQHGALFDSLSVYDNVSFALVENLNLSKSELDDRVEKLLNSVGLSFDHSEKMPAELSGGQRKRVALARAIAMHPSIMMYDEPTTGLDPLTTEMVSNLIKDTGIKYNLTSIVISHDAHTALDIAENLAFLKDGAIHYSGDPRAIFQHEDPEVRDFFTIGTKNLDFYQENK